MRVTVDPISSTCNSRVPQPSLARGRSIALVSSDGSNPDAAFMPLEYKPCSAC